MTRVYPAGYRHPQPRSAWRGQLPLALVLGVALWVLLAWTAAVA